MLATLDLAKSNIGILVIGAVAVLTAAQQLYLRIGKPMAMAWRRLLRIHEIIDKSWPTLTYIAENLKPNGGSSLRDAIDRIEGNSLMSNLRLTAFLQMTDKPMYECNAAGLVTMVNRAWCELTDTYPQDALGNGWITAIHEDDRERVAREWANAIRYERDFDMTFRYKTGQKVSSHCVPLRTINGKVVGFFGIATIVKST